MVDTVDAVCMWAGRLAEKGRTRRFESLYAVNFIFEHAWIDQQPISMDTLYRHFEPETPWRHLRLLLLWG